MKVKLLPSTFEKDGTPSRRQHLSCLVVNDSIAVDAGSLAMAATDEMRANLRDVVLTHAHLDHIAGLPLYIDDLFASLDSPVKVHALQDVIEIIERDVFNWSIFPRFSELQISSGRAMEYIPIEFDRKFVIKDVEFSLFGADHKVPSAGISITDDSGSIAITGDTATLDGLRDVLSKLQNVKAVLVECAFPNELSVIADNSHHMTPDILARQLDDIRPDCPVFVINIKPSYRDTVVGQLGDLRIQGLEVMAVGRDYFW